MKLVTPLFALVLSTLGLHAQFISWGSATSISDASDIATNGGYVDALQSHSSNGTATGVVVPLNVLNPTSGVSTLFGIFVPGTVADGTFRFSNNIGTNGSDGSNSDATPYQEVLDHTSYIFTPGIATVTMNGLTNGDTYQLQVWAADGGRPTTLTSGTNVVNLDSDVNSPGQFVIGSFVAQGTTQSFTFQNTPGSVVDVAAGEINALSLRDLSSVPEPSTWAMLAVALGGLVLVARRRLTPAL